ncbi:MAG: HD domain-containing protein [Spirochaetales bacterium]|nr:HD domain-containing protein [Spirochaetales bacterium]
MVEAPVRALRDAGYGVYYTNYSALDRYFRLPSYGPLYLSTDATLVDLAQTFDRLEYAGLPYEDAVVRTDERPFMIRCDDADLSPRPFPYSIQGLLYDPVRDVFLDPQGIYPDLRSSRLRPNGGVSSLYRLADAAVLASRYHYRVEPEELALGERLPEPDPAFQRQLLLSIMAGKHPEKGLKLLYYSGFVQTFWPELQKMSGVAHVKDYHPEGNGWEHTLETFQYRKNPDPVLSLALLLHDVGKPAAASTPERAFDGHAELGAEIAARFLRRLGFSRQTVEEVTFLVRYHMMPGALGVLPLHRSGPLMASDLFPVLLELYRADLSASYESPEGYYEACRVFRNYQKHRANPYRRSDGRKSRRGVAQP